MSKVFEISFENCSKFGKMKWKSRQRFKNWNEKRRKGKIEKWNENDFYIIMKGGIDYWIVYKSISLHSGYHPVEWKPYNIRVSLDGVVYDSNLE